MNMIFEISVKSSVESKLFLKKVSIKKSPVVPHSPLLKKSCPWSPTGEVFTLIPNIIFIFLYNYVTPMKIAKNV